MADTYGNSVTYSGQAFATNLQKPAFAVGPGASLPDGYDPNNYAGTTSDPNFGQPGHPGYGDGGSYGGAGIVGAFGKAANSIAKAVGGTAKGVETVLIIGVGILVLSYAMKYKAK